MKAQNYRKESVLSYFNSQGCFHDLEINVLLHSEEFSDIERTCLERGESVTQAELLRGEIVIERPSKTGAFDRLLQWLSADRSDQKNI